MKHKIPSLLTLTLVLGVSASAAPITIYDSLFGGSGDVDNVLFNDDSLIDEGLIVQGTFNGSGDGYNVEFTSSSGSGLLAVSGGQATIIGGEGNSPYSQLSFSLKDDATFTKAQINPDATADGLINFSVSYILGAGSPYTEQFTVNGNGQNFFTILAGDGARITMVSYSSPDTTFSDSNQVRIGGFLAPTTTIPDGGTTAAMLGLGMIGLAALARRR
jgi:hypothetical protein